MNWTRLIGVFALLAAVAAPTLADGGVTFTDIAQNGGAGIEYARLHSPDRIALFNATTLTPIPFPPVPNFFPNTQILAGTRPFGSPGVVVFDYDLDGDQDIYVTNGPGRANSLFQNQFSQNGQATFIDRAISAGVDATAVDSNGVCAGDIDNDGDKDLFVTNAKANNILFRNNGNGTFTDISAGSGLDIGADQVQVGCSFGDINGDGLLDVTTAVNLANWTNREQTFLPGDHPDLRNNDLFKNLGGGHFEDVSASSGIENIPHVEHGSWTWVAAMVDIDHDGDIDILNAHMQGAPPQNSDPDDIRGYNRALLNDGTGQFTVHDVDLGLSRLGGWMGYAFADYDCNGLTDFFVSNIGDYMGNPGAPSAFYFQQPDHTFTFPPIGDKIGKTPWGWGASPFDYDNDGDFDLIYHGAGDNHQAFAADNPGALFRNDGLCSASFSYDATAVLRDHRPREESGVAVGDLNNDGFDDIVSAAGTYFTPTARYFDYTLIVGASGALWDTIAKVQVNYTSQITPNFLTWDGPEYLEGDLAVEINSGGNGNKSVQVQTVGGVGTTLLGRVNRDGAGAIIHFTPEGSTKTAIKPVVLGASFASQDSEVNTFGLGTAARGTLEVVWPHTGIRNRLYNVKAGEKITFPEIPCSFAAGNGATFREYLSCVTDALTDHVDAGHIARGDRTRFLLSALRAWGFRFAGPEGLSAGCDGLEAFEALLGDDEAQ
jgi:hypothetical protein